MVKWLPIFIFIALSALLLRFFVYYSHDPKYQNGQEIVLQVVLQEEPKVSVQGQQFSIQTDRNQRLYIRTGLSRLYHYGDTLAIDGMLQVKTNQQQRTYLTLNFPKITVLPEPKNPLFEASRMIMKKSKQIFEAVLPPTSAGLLLGIVFGTKGDFTADFKSALQTTGVLHVIAASGMNVSFFTGAVMFSLGKIFKRRVALILSVIAALFYSFLVGFEPSILRATIMAMIAFSASFFGRQNLAIVSIFSTGFLMLLWQPSFLFDVGFQLSFLATLGILIVKPRIDRIGGKEGLGWLGSFKEDLTTTLSAQITTFPILLGTFGTFGVLSVVVNVLVLWTVPILMLLGSLAVLFGLIFVPLGKLLLLLCLPFLFFFERIVLFFGSLGWVFKVDSFPWEVGAGYYLVLAAVVLVLKKRIKSS